MQFISKIASRLTACALVGAGLNLMSPALSSAGTFQSDFNSGVPPAGMNLWGSAQSYDHSTGGVNNSGVLKLTDTSGSQTSSAIIDDFDGGQTIGGFDVTFQLYIGGGTGADGMSFVFGDFADESTWGEEGPGTMRGLTITFDEYNNGGTPAEAPAIDVKWNNVTLFHRLVGATGATTPASPIGSATTIRSQTTAGGAPVYWPVKIHADTDGTLDLVYNNVVIFTNLPVFRPFMTDVDPPQYGSAYRFAFGARTGGSADNHWIDDLKITTVPLDDKSGQPALTLVSPQPAGLNAGAAGGVEVVFTNGTYSIDPASVTMRYNNGAVTPTVSQADGNTRIAYRGNNSVLPTGAGTVVVGYATTSNPLVTNYFSFNFVVDPFTTINSNAPIASVDTTKPGFKMRLYQFDTIRAPGNDQNQTILAERQLSMGYLDPATGQPYPNTADLSTAEPDGTFIEPDVINFSYRAPAAVGNFSANSTPAREDKLFPGIPGTTGSELNFVVEFDAFLQLKAGGNRFGVNSDDGFRVSFGPGFDAPAQVVGQFSGGRGSADTLFDIVVPSDGYYPVRVVYWQGGGDANLEFFWIDPATGSKVLVNDPDNLNAPRAYRESPVSRPSITRALPVQNWIGAFADEDVIIDITDGALPLAADSVKLFINNAEQTVTTSKSGAVTTIRRAGSLDNLLPSGLNNVQLVYGYTENGSTVNLTNSYSFTVAPYYTPLAAANKVSGASDPGFHAFVYQIDKSGDANQGNGARISGGGDANRMPWPEVELIAGNINPTNGLPYPNLADAGPNGNSTFDFDVINWQFNSAAADTVQSGWFRTDSPAAPLPGANTDVGVPGFPGRGTSYGGLENAVMEITTYLELKRGVQVLGFNSDDGFLVTSGTDVHDTLPVVGFFGGGRGNSATLVAPVGQNPPVIGPNVSAGSTLFSVIVPEDGVYPFRILFWQGGTGFNAEFFSINKTNGAFVLVGDTASGGIPAYRTYTGPAKPWVKFSVSPNPWDNGYQQVGPGPITMIGATRNNNGSSDIYNYQNTAYFVRPWADVVIGAVVANGTTDANLRLLLNGAEVPATKTTSGTDVTISYKPQPPLPSGSTNVASLVYAGVTNSWRFTVQPYTNLNAADALPLSSADANSRGFKVKVVKTASNGPFAMNATLAARAEAQLAGALGDNIAIPGPGPDGSYIYTNIINWNVNLQTNAPGVQLGNFQTNRYGAGTGWPFPFYGDEPLPGFPTSGPINTDNAAAEVFAYLEFPTNGYYRLGVNSDDGFAMKVGTPGVTNGTVIFSADLSKGASDIPVSFVVPQPGLYPIRLVWYNGGGGANLEFFSYTESGGKIPINDRNNPAAIKAYYAVAGSTLPHITGVTAAGGNITVTWENGGTLESATSLNGVWTTTGDSDGSFTEPISGATKFYRVKQ